MYKLPPFWEIMTDQPINLTTDRPVNRDVTLPIKENRVSYSFSETAVFVLIPTSTAYYRPQKKVIEESRVDARIQRGVAVPFIEINYQTGDTHTEENLPRS